MDGARLLHFYPHCWVSSFLAAAPERAQSDIPSAAKWMRLFLISHTMVPGASELRPAQSRASSSALRQRIFVWLPRLRSLRVNSVLRSGKHLHPAVRRVITPPLLPRAATCYQNCIFALRIRTLPSQNSLFLFQVSRLCIRIEEGPRSILLLSRKVQFQGGPQWLPISGTTAFLFPPQIPYGEERVRYEPAAAPIHPKRHGCTKAMRFSRKTVTSRQRRQVSICSAAGPAFLGILNRPQYLQLHEQKEARRNGSNRRICSSRLVAGRLYDEGVSPCGRTFVDPELQR